MNTMAPLQYADASQRYGMERGFQQQAAQMLPGIAQMQSGEGLAQSGGAPGCRPGDDAQAQKPIDEAMARHDFSQQEPYQRLSQYAQLLGAGSPSAEQTARTS